jgi:hypothetical protein
MSEGAAAGPPIAWVSKRDGRLVPFDADKISRSLFSATENVGRPDAFMARELTDGVLHFLAADLAGTTPTTAQVSDMVVKIVRELGQPALAQAFAEFARARPRPGEKAAAGPASVETRLVNPVLGMLPARPALPDARALAWRSGQACLRDYATQAVFTRDLVAAQRDGLLTLTGLETPFELASSVLGPPQPGDRGLVEAVERHRQVVGQVLAVDGPEYALAFTSGAHDEARAAYAREIAIGLRATELRAVVNLNGDSPPRWASELAEGPLFDEPLHLTRPEPLAEHAEGLVEELLRPGGGNRVRIDWHLGERDFASEAGLVRQARRILDDAPLALVFDRPRRPVALAEGLDRRYPAVLMSVALHLPRLLQQTATARQPERFLNKLGSLARLALSAGVQKREFLRKQHPEMTRGFLLDRAHLVVVPVGLEAVVRELAGCGLCGGPAGLEVGRGVVERLRAVLEQDGRASHLETCLDSAADFARIERADRPSEPGSEPAEGDVVGLTPWDADAAPKAQLRAAGALHAAAGGGTAAVLLPRERPVAAEEIAGLVRYAGQQTDVIRLRFVRMGRAPRQLTAPWEQGA